MEELQDDIKLEMDEKEEERRNEIEEIHTMDRGLNHAYE